MSLIFVLLSLAWCPPSAVVFLGGSASGSCSPTFPCRPTSANILPREAARLQRHGKEVRPHFSSPDQLSTPIKI